MKVGLIDVDGKMPNLALMKISAWHKSRGDEVKWFDPLFDHPDRVYASKVFNYTPDFGYWPDCEVFRGGTGYDIRLELPRPVERMTPDYSIYPDCDYAIGFITRGCPNCCPWCVVPEKEGHIRFDRSWREIARPDARKIVFLDNNVLASGEAVRDLWNLAVVNRGLKRGETYQIDFNQGIDSRLVPDFADLIGSLPWLRYVRLACDSVDSILAVKLAIDAIRDWNSRREIFIYLLVGEDVEEANARMTELQRYKGITFFAQPYRDPHKVNEISEEQQEFASYVNVKGSNMCRRISFKDYRDYRRIVA